MFNAKKYEAVATVVELRHLNLDVRRLDALAKNRLIVEHAELAESVPAAIAALDEKLAEYEEAQKAKRELAKKAAAEGDAMVADKPEKAPKKAAKKAAKKKAARGKLDRGPGNR